MKSKAFIVCILYSVLCILNVQAQELLNYPLDTVNGEEVYRYEVERSIGLYRIGVKFSVSQGDIIRLNPQLSERGVHYGEILYIPTGRIGIKESQPVVVKTTVTETPVPVETLAKEEKSSLLQAFIQAIQAAQQDSTVTKDSVPAREVVTADGRRVIELALLMPFESLQTKRSGNADRMLEFYQGAILALDELQNDSVLFRLRVYDTERSERRINALCDSTELDHVQGIIGPIYPIQIERMAKWCDIHQVPMLLPFSDDSELTKRPNVLQFNSTDKQEADSLCQWMMQRDSLLHCIALDVRESDMSESMRTLRKQMRVNGIPVSTLPLRDLLNDSAAYVLDTARENLIILHSDKVQHVRILIPHLTKLQAEGYRLRIVSQYSWLKEEIALPQVYTSMFTSEVAREAYDEHWKKYFINEHVSELPRYDLLGHDLMRALVAWLQGITETEGLQSFIRWQQTGEGEGWQNGYLQVVEK